VCKHKDRSVIEHKKDIASIPKLRSGPVAECLQNQCNWHVQNTDRFDARSASAAQAQHDMIKASKYAWEGPMPIKLKLSEGTMQTDFVTSSLHSQPNRRELDSKDVVFQNPEGVLKPQVSQSLQGNVFLPQAAKTTSPPLQPFQAHASFYE
jgi:hypothetical protein